MVVEVHGGEGHEEEEGEAGGAPERRKLGPALEHDDERVGDVEARHRAEDVARAPVHAGEVGDAEPRVDAREVRALRSRARARSTVQPCVWKYQGGAAG